MMHDSAVQIWSFQLPTGVMEDKSIGINNDRIYVYIFCQKIRAGPTNFLAVSLWYLGAVLSPLKTFFLSHCTCMLVKHVSLAV